MGPLRVVSPPAPTLLDAARNRAAGEVPEGWGVSYVRCWDGSVVWSAIPPGGRTAVVIEHSAGRLVERVLDPESWLPQAIERTRAALDGTPESWANERAALVAQLESLLRQQDENRD